LGHLGPVFYKKVKWSLHRKREYGEFEWALTFRNYKLVFLETKVNKKKCKKQLKKIFGNVFNKMIVEYKKQLIKRRKTEIMEYAPTSPNRSVYASLPSVARPPQRLGHSATLHSYAVAPAHFVRPANATHLLIRAAKTS
jgi:hypothetical protein